MPVTINDEQWTNSYVCSPYTGAITYPIDELHHLDRGPTRILIRGLLGGLSPILRWGQINRVVAINNWLFSTNLYSEDPVDVAAVTRFILERFPSHVVMFRSLNRATNSEWIKKFEAEGYLMIPSRQVYLFEMASKYWQKVNARRDQNLLRKSNYEIVFHDELDERDDSRIAELYRQLYIQKYSKWNPVYTESMVRLWRETKLLEFFGLRDPAGRLNGIVGLFQVGDIVSAPVVGYEMQEPQSAGLYRMLMAIVLRMARERQLRLNLSSGAADFKRVRGGEPHIEYSAVCVKHLSTGKQMVWKLLNQLLRKIGVPLLKKYKL